MARLSEEQVERIMQLHWKGESEREIARIVGCSRSAVWGVLQRTKHEVAA